MGVRLALYRRARARSGWPRGVGGVRGLGATDDERGHDGAVLPARCASRGRSDYSRPGLVLRSEREFRATGRRSVAISTMPAVTVSNTLALPRITSVDPQHAALRPVRTITTAPRGFEGEGFPVRRAFAGVSTADLDPFIHLDQMGEVDYAPGEPKGTPWHPHRGFETVTYIIDGTFDHQDSHGGGGTITNGDTQWMTAGSGLLHIEAPPEWMVQKGGLFHGIQLWVNLPRDAKWNPPKYQDIRSSQVGLATSADAGALVRVIAGELGTTQGPGSTYTPMTMVHATVEPGARLDLPWEVDYNALVYVLSGEGTVGDEA